ncbi:arylesterase [Mucilaginibacter agri]|nr:arylesterase [Mucilaginibacter agri]
MHQFKKCAVALFALLAMGCGDKKTSDNTATDTATSKPATKQAATNTKTILVFGDSLTAGYGLDDVSESFPGVIKARIDSLKLPYNVINAGVSGETSAGGLSRIDWVLKQKPDIFLLELGANDGLRGNSVQQTIDNLQAIIDKVKAKYPAAKIILLGMQVPPSMGQKYVSDFKKMYPDLAEKNHIGLVPFLLDGVGGNPKLNQADGIHPNPTGAKIVAENVWRVLQPQL